jgi:hypothetical protein
MQQAGQRNPVSFLHGPDERNAKPYHLLADHQFINFLVACSLSLRNLR